MSSTREDTFRHKGLRQKLVDELRVKGITDEQVLRAINSVPRHFFLDSAFDKIAYEDRAFPIDSEQTISQPYTVAFQTALLQVKKFDKILEIGTGSVYQSTILSEMGALLIYTIERQKKLYDLTQNNYPLKSTHKNIRFFYGDGFLGLKTYAPFDKIIITAAAPFIPQELIAQLKIGGIMVLPLGEETTIMTRITKLSATELKQEKFQEFSFVPMLSGKNA
jgi:protein-L-isoaspartate(D-aspartate) O-methyltransferase